MAKKRTQKKKNKNPRAPIIQKEKIPAAKKEVEEKSWFGLRKTKKLVDNPEYVKWKQRALQQQQNIHTDVPTEGWMTEEHPAYTVGPRASFTSTPGSRRVNPHIPPVSERKSNAMTVWGAIKSAPAVLGHAFTHGLRAINPWGVGNRDLGTDDNVPISKKFKKKELDLILYVWNYCFNTYRPETQLENEDNNYIWFSYKFPTGFENAGFVRYNPEDKVFILAFRGSQNEYDFHDDAASSKFITIDKVCGQKLPIPIEATYGPALRADNILNTKESNSEYTTIRANKLLSQAINGELDIDTFIVTGHSLGGGNAEAAAACILQFLPSEYFDPNNVFNENAKRFLLVTFEAMRGLKIDSIRALYNNPDTSSKIKYIDEAGGFRILNDKDPVPQQPSFITGASHIGQTIVVTGYFNEFMKEHEKWGVKNPFALIGGPAFNPNEGPHSMVPTSDMLNLIADNIDKYDISEHVYHALGRGKLRKKRVLTPAQRAAMKQRMAYVRSFIRKKR